MSCGSWLFVQSPVRENTNTQYADTKRNATKNASNTVMADSMSSRLVHDRV